MKYQFTMAVRFECDCASDALDRARQITHNVEDMTGFLTFLHDAPQPIKGSREAMDAIRDGLFKEAPPQ